MWGLVAKSAPGPPRSLRRRRPLENLFDDLALRVGVVLHVLPLAPRELALRPLVELAVARVPAQVVAEEEHALDLGAARGEDVEVDLRLEAFQQPVLEPFGLSDAKHVARR